VIKDQNMLDVYDRIEGYCNLLIERIHLIEQERLVGLRIIFVKELVLIFSWNNGFGVVVTGNVPRNWKRQHRGCSMQLQGVEIFQRFKRFVQFWTRGLARNLLLVLLSWGTTVASILRYVYDMKISKLCCLCFAS